MANYGKTFRLQEEKCVNKAEKIFYYAIQNYYQGLIMYFQSLIIYFQGLIINYQSLRIVLNAVIKTFILRGKMFCIDGIKQKKTPTFLNAGAIWYHYYLTLETFISWAPSL